MGGSGIVDTDQLSGQAELGARNEPVLTLVSKFEVGKRFCPGRGGRLGVPEVADDAVELLDGTGVGPFLVFLHSHCLLT